MQRLGCFLAPSPPAEKAAARQDKAGQPGAGDGAGDGGSSPRVAEIALKEVSIGSENRNAVATIAQTKSPCIASSPEPPTAMNGVTELL